jgi:hypothetical protein
MTLKLSDEAVSLLKTIFFNKELTLPIKWSKAVVELQKKLGEVDKPPR